MLLNTTRKQLRDYSFSFKLQNKKSPYTKKPIAWYLETRTFRLNGVNCVKQIRQTEHNWFTGTKHEMLNDQTSWGGSFSKKPSRPFTRPHNTKAITWENKGQENMHGKNWIDDSLQLFFATAPFKSVHSCKMLKLYLPGHLSFKTVLEARTS